MVSYCMRMTLWTLVNFPSPPPPFLSSCLPSLWLIAILRAIWCITRGSLGGNPEGLLYWIHLRRCGDSTVTRPIQTPQHTHTRALPLSPKFNGKLTIQSRIKNSDCNLGVTLSKTCRYAAAVVPWVSGLGLKRGVRETGLTVDQLTNDISMLMSSV